MFPPARYDGFFSPKVSLLRSPGIHLSCQHWSLLLPSGDAFLLRQFSSLSGAHSVNAHAEAWLAQGVSSLGNISECLSHPHPTQLSVIQTEWAGCFESLPQEGVSGRSCDQYWQIPCHPADCEASSQFLNMFPLIPTEYERNKYLSMSEHIMSQLKSDPAPALQMQVTTRNLLTMPVIHQNVFEQRSQVNKAICQHGRRVCVS